MSTLHFEQYHYHQPDLILGGQRFQARVSLYDHGIWRIHLWQRPQDAHKGSAAILSPPAPIAPLLDPDGEGVRLESPDGDHLWLQLDPFRWQWQDLTALGVEAERQRSLQQETAPSDTPSHHPISDSTDGLPRGAGFTLTLKAPPGDTYYGLGERTGFLNKRGRRWVNWNTDEFHHSPQADPLYQSHPFLIGCHGGRYWGLYLDESWYSSFDLACTDPDTLAIHSAGPTFDLYLIPGPTPSEVVQRYTRLTGRAPLPPLWALGMHQCRWSYPDAESVTAIVAAYQAHTLPLSAIWMDIDYMESYKVFTFSPHRFPDPAGLIHNLRDQGVRTVVIVDPAVKQERGYPVYESGSDLGAWVSDERDTPLVGEVWPKPTVWPDFSRPEVQQWWGQWHQVYLKAGIAGIWNDMNEPSAFNWKPRTLPLNARHGRHSHAEMHNLYGLHMAQATVAGLQQLAPEQRPFVLTRAGSPGIQRYSWVWTGDNSSYWEHLEMSVPMLLNLGLSGIPFVGADIGGFSGDCDGELLTRWTWLGAFYPFMRNHAGKGSRRQEPWEFGEPWLNAIRQALQLRYRLLPYLYTLAWEASETGLPPMRPLLLEFPADPQTAALHDQFMLGSALLVAPALRPGQTHRAVYLPTGRWQDFWTGDFHQGPTWIVAPTPIDHIPLFQREGSAIPLQATGTVPATAEWEALVWRGVLGEQALDGQVWQDAGEGFGPGHLQHLQGRTQPGGWHFTGVTGELELLQAAAPKQVNTPHTFHNQQLHVSLRADQTTEVKWF